MANKRPMLVKMGDSSFDKIKAFYLDPENYPLSPTLEEIRKRWVMVRSMALNAYSKFEIVQVLVQDCGISEAQAYNDIRNSENIFGSISETEEKAFRAMWIEWAKDYLKRSRQRQDRKSEGKALDLLARYGVRDENPDFNPEKLIHKQIVFNIPKAQLEMLKKLNSGGVVDFNSIPTQETDFIDVSDD
jgi:hypothetical protein